MTSPCSSRRFAWFSTGLFKTAQAIALGCWVVAGSLAPAHAEGSRDLVAGGGSRPYIDADSRTTANIPRQNTWRVFVQTGETVNLGSSVPSSANNSGASDIVYTSPFGSQNGVCDVDATTGFGLIDTVTKETAGPLPNTNGYTPCSFVATETGLYTVVFHAPNANGTGIGNPPAQSVTAAFPTDAAQRAAVSAWDITIRDSNDVPQSGRVFTNYIAFNMGANGSTVALNSDLYIQTKDGFLYKTDMNGMDPFGFLFFANNRGFIDQTGGDTTLYKSARATDNSMTAFNGNVRVQRPNVPDTATDLTHWVFLNPPAPETLNELSIPLTPTAPATPTNFRFTGAAGGSGNQTLVAVGGTFSFDVTGIGSYEIIIDTDANGTFDPSVDRVLQNTFVAGSLAVVWDGNDRAGTPLQPRPGNAPYNAQIRARGGEYHFPLLDAENNPSGMIITMQNPPAAFPTGKSATTVYYDNSAYTTKNGTSVTPGFSGGTAPSPLSNTVGFDSSAGVQQFSSSWGDQQGIDTWTYFPSDATITPLVITAANQANVRGTKSVRFLQDTDGSGSVTVGDRVEYTITYSNLAPNATSDATNFIISDTLPSQVSFVSAELASQTSGNTLTLNSAYAGSGALTSLGTLRIGDTITLRIVATINTANAGNAIANQASATFTTPDNAATTGTILTDATPTTGASATPAVGEDFAQVADNSANTGNNPTLTNDDDPTLLTVVTATSPQLRLVKRITRLGRDGTVTPLTAAIDVTSGTAATDDNATGWPTPTATATQFPGPGTTASFSSFLQGVVNRTDIYPEDEIDYTIYFLSDGGQLANQVVLCDFIPANSTYVAGTLSVLQAGNITPLTDAADADAGQFIAAATPPPAACLGTNHGRGAVVVNLGSLPRATGAGIPNTAYGYIRFRTKVD
jgi:fimbrial isopeptide formation D2 family protein/uncharacterized repeat protein (TIGR01451 family)